MVQTLGRLFFFLARTSDSRHPREWWIMNLDENCWVDMFAANKERLYTVLLWQTAQVDAGEGVWVWKVWSCYTIVDHDEPAENKASRHRENCVRDWRWLIILSLNFSFYSPLTDVCCSCNLLRLHDTFSHLVLWYSWSLGLSCRGESWGRKTGWRRRWRKLRTLISPANIWKL